MRRALSLLLLILLAGLSVMPWYVGQQARAVYADLLHDMERQGVRLIENNYRSGWLTSRAVTVLAYPVPPLHPEWPSLHLISTIRHGPLNLKALADGRVELLAAQVETYLELAETDQPPRRQSTRLSTRISLDGDTHLRFLPASAKGKLSDLRGELRLDSVSRRIWGSLTLSPFEYADAGGRRLRQGILDMELDSARGAAGLRLGSSHLKLSEMNLMTPDWPASLHIEGLSLETRTGVQQASAWTTADCRIERIGFDDSLIEDVQLRMRIDGLSAAVLARLVGSLGNLAAQQADDGRKAFALFGLVMGNLTRLLKGGPQLSLERLHLNTPEGPVDAELELKLTGMSADQVMDASVWLRSLSASGRLELPEILIQEILSARARDELRQMYETRKEMDAEFQVPESALQATQAMQRARDQIDTLLRQEFVVRNAGQLSTRFRLSAGLLSINGKTVPLLP